MADLSVCRNKSKVHERERAFLCTHVCACVFIRGDSSVQWDKESVNHNQKGNGRQEGEEGAAVCPESLDGMWATVRRGLGMWLIWETRAEVPCFQ